MLLPPLLTSSSFLLAVASSAACVYGFGQDAGYDVQKVKDQMKILATHSWEYGTAAEALLELDTPSLSVFGDMPFPVPDSPSSSAMDYAKPHIRLDSSTLVDGDGAVGDPAALGIMALLLGKTDERYRDAAERQTQYLLQAPRWPNGAISHRAEYAELWADFIYMAPPYLAYHGVYSSNISLIRLAVDQCTLYREVLKTPSGLWTHIVGPRSPDAGRWSTGNAWAAAGMLRVLATISKAPITRYWNSERRVLKGYIKEILDGVIAVQPDENGLLRNYLDDETWFGEVSGTAMLAAVAYRAHVLDRFTFGEKYFLWAEQRRGAIAASVDSEGILAPAINPLWWGDRTPVMTGSPEGNSFGVLLWAAYRDCVVRRQSHF